MRKAIVIASTVLLLLAVNLGIVSRERLVSDGRVVLLELGPVDPRSFMQGDYMALVFGIERAAFREATPEEAGDGRLVVALDASGVATYRRFDDGARLAPDEARLRYRIRNGRMKIATNAFFFEEGRAREYATARYGEFRVAPDGDAILTGLRDRDLAALGPRTTQ